MDFFRIRNLRSLEDTGRIALKPITVLVGTNSSGKSSFLRSFPLLKQSIETPTDSPLLWFGRYVDYGSLSDAANRAASEKRIAIEFGFKLEVPMGYYMSHEDLDLSPVPIPIAVSITLGPSEISDGARIVACDIEFDGLPVHLSFSQDTRVTKFTVGEFDALKAGPPLALRPAAFILPSIFSYEDGGLAPARRVVFQPYFPEHPPTQDIFHSPFRDPIRNDALKDIIRPMLHGRASDETVERIALSLAAGTASWMLEHFRRISAPPSWSASIAAIGEKSEVFQRLRERIIANTIPIFLEKADQYIAEFAAGVGYMGPLRATAQRYYRIQDLAVREVDFQGENLAMFLRSLSDAQREQFASFSRRYFNFEVSHRSSGGHVEIILKEHGSPEGINLADMGFGYSQVLPVIAQLWSSVPQGRRRVKRRHRLLAIEQPELHLHPAYQTRLADMLAGFAKNPRQPLSLIVETHSESIVNRLGEMVREDRLRPEDVQILLFSKPPRSPASIIRTAGFHEDGALKDWPYGFFASGAIDSDVNSGS
ncbi:AAA family ATPase [Pyxidicoccus caerfyrddinensis]|uniref:AAA family ATPase n=1 Tax=Pyxidicoccus caerfyrddinensis TaxID=2709663 RepID=UPI0013D9C6C5|nr:AAA family ATPase [Pyxidicoccus caerfyrddinensis]